MSELKVYFADLAAYNSGHLHGVWVDACDGEESVREQIDNMIKASPFPGAEEYEVHDQVGFDSIVLKNQDISDICELAEFINEHEELALGLLDNFHNCVEFAKNALRDNYQGCYGSFEDYAKHVCRECYDIPDVLENYIDYKALAHDLELTTYTIETYDGVHVFIDH